MAGSSSLRSSSRRVRLVAGASLAAARHLLRDALAILNGGLVVGFASSSRRVRLVAGASLAAARHLLAPRAARRWRFPRRLALKG
jgi:hypothetical protein